MSFKPGFITPPWPHERGDSIKAAALIERFEKEAMWGCGLHFEIYEYRLVKRLLAAVSQMNAADVETLRSVALQRGHHLDDQSLEECRQGYRNTLAEIRKEQE
ncbi:hypothetical protein KW811_22175 [Enterobacter quasiroggenkampii]|uniref:hypothetical protein n=1 Tax=Enterobacter quasiroggenkampii TaxID=2497436 RepID=UPI0021CDF7FA|nr:hypothetical protein [Enterobacter quasiroggenkampii]MCU6401195.1 hypothetical protein [Enterobacter quasiroggenkampii]